MFETRQPKIFLHVYSHDIWIVEPVMHYHEVDARDYRTIRITRSRFPCDPIY
jgi:hypothetical protein